MLQTSTYLNGNAVPDSNCFWVAWVTQQRAYRVDLASWARRIPANNPLQSKSWDKRLQVQNNFSVTKLGNSITIPVCVWLSTFNPTFTHAQIFPWKHRGETQFSIFHEDASTCWLEELKIKLLTFRTTGFTPGTAAAAQEVKAHKYLNNSGVMLKSINT